MHRRQYHVNSRLFFICREFLRRTRVKELRCEPTSVASDGLSLGCLPGTKRNQFWRIEVWKSFRAALDGNVSRRLCPLIVETTAISDIALSHAGHEATNQPIIAGTNLGSKNYPIKNVVSARHESLLKIKARRSRIGRHQNRTFSGHTRERLVGATIPYVQFSAFGAAWPAMGGGSNSCPDPSATARGGDLSRPRISGGGYLGPMHSENVDSATEVVVLSRPRGAKNVCFRR